MAEQPALLYYCLVHLISRGRLILSGLGDNVGVKGTEYGYDGSWGKVRELPVA